MILQKKTINNVPTLVPLTADTGSGVPVGTIIGQYKKVNMSGYLYLDGSTFDQTLYPALYAYLGTNILPDYREFVLVGAEQNATSATIADHDVFTQGEEKNDQLQNHTHATFIRTMFQSGADATGTINPGGGGYEHGETSGVHAGYRNGTTTRTKEKAVFWYIKATTGIIESEATEMLNLYNEQNSYSTSEINTGKKWIDGKPIYRKVINYGALPNNTTKSVNHGISNIGTVIEPKCIAKTEYGTQIQLSYASSPAYFYVTNGAITIVSNSDMSGFSAYAILEYTKTTD